MVAFRFQTLICMVTHCSGGSIFFALSLFDATFIRVTLPVGKTSYESMQSECKLMKLQRYVVNNKN